MERKNAAALRWLDTAVAGHPGFGPDRRRCGPSWRPTWRTRRPTWGSIFPDMAPEEAEARALSQMGDPEEIGRELARIHRPWLGYLWRVSQGALAAVLLMLVLVGANVIGGSSTLGGWYGREGGWQSHQDGAVLLAPPEERITLENCTLTAPQAAVWTSGEGKELEVVLRTESFHFWEKDGGQFEHISAVDDLGGRYNSQYEWGQLGLGWRRGYVSVHRDGLGAFPSDLSPAGLRDRPGGPVGASGL